MYAGTFNDTEKDMWQTRHSHEQEFGDLWGLLEQNDFPLILPKHWWFNF